jgi:23S rRNA (uracil1939-C5)-methyltransferase
MEPFILEKSAGIALPNKGSLIDLVIEDLAFGAKGVARTGDFVWFVDFAIPGQTVRAKVIKRKKNYGEARLESVLSPSPDQVEAPCPHFGVCGGCRLQHLKYETQVHYKTRQVQDILERIGGLPPDLVRPVLPAETVYGYRNKMEFTFSDRPWLTEKNLGETPFPFALGMHVPGRFDKVLDINACLLQSETANRLYAFVKEKIRENGLPAYGPKSHQGVWRFVVIREGKNTGDLMLNLVTSNQEPEKTFDSIDWLMHKVCWKHPGLTTAVHSVTDRRGMVAVGDSEKLLLGMGVLKEKIENRTFEISPSAFFQTNTAQTGRMFRILSDLAEFDGSETLYDLYCGTGAIGIFLADRVKRVVGIETVASAVEDGRKNAELNGFSNILFHRADMKDALGDGFVETHGRPDVLVLDPPRGGTHPRTIRDVIRISPPKILYVSCNPPHLARDLVELRAGGYSVSAIQPVDMFPHTAHVEVVASLKKN